MYAFYPWFTISTLATNFFHLKKNGLPTCQVVHGYMHDDAYHSIPSTNELHAYILCMY